MDVGQAANFFDDLAARRCFQSGLPDFSWYSIPKWGEIYHMARKYTKGPENIPNGSKIDHMARKYTDSFHSKTLQNVPKFGFFV
jgi:hypothetical protein